MIPITFPASTYLNGCLTHWTGWEMLAVHPCDALPKVGDQPPWLSLLYAYATQPEAAWHPTMKLLSDEAKAGADAKFLSGWFDHATPSARRALALARAVLPDHFAPSGPVDKHAESLRPAAEQVELALIRQWLALDLDVWSGPKVSLMTLFVGSEGIACELDLQVVPLPETLTGAHGCLVRAPGAALLTLDAAFQAGLSQVQSLLQRVLAPPTASGRSVAAPLAISWRVRALDKSDGSGNAVTPYLTELVGPSLTAALAVGSLWLLRDHLAEPWKSRWHRALRELKPDRFCATAAFLGYEGPAPHLPEGVMDDPLRWTLAPVGGVELKFDALAEHRPNRHVIRKAFVAQHQDVSGTKVAAVKCQTLAALIQAAHEASEPVRLPEAFEALEDALTLGDSEEDEVKVSQTLLDAVHESPLPRLLKAGQAPTQDEAEKVLRVWWLKRYAHWASGRYQAFGPLRGGPTDEPVALMEHFHPIDIDPDERWEDKEGRFAAAQNTRREDLQANSLPELFDKCPRDVAFRLHAASAGGKTTLLAHHEMETAVNALRQYRHTGVWGELALWLPMRDYPTRTAVDPSAAVDALWARVEAKYPDLAAALQAWKSGGVELPGMRLRWLCDAVNEMPAEGEPQRRQAQDALFRGLTEQGAALGWLPPVFTVRTHSQNHSLEGARGCTLLTWDAPSRNRYMDKRLGAHSESVKILRAAIDTDKRDDREKFFATPGHLAAQCTLMAAGVVSEPASNRAQLFCTLLWLRLAQELKKGQLSPSLLSDDELDRLDRMPRFLEKEGGWRWPKRMGPLMQALSTMAVYQQHLDPASRLCQRQQQAEEGEPFWSMSAPRDWLLSPPHRGRSLELNGVSERDLLRAAQHLNLLQPDDEGERVTWSHQLWLELFAALGLQPNDGEGTWIDTPVPVLPDMEDVWREHLASGKRRNEFRVPAVPPLPEEETLRYLIQLRGDVVKVVERVLTAGNAPLAARLALENWSAFGEPVYPHDDCLNPWRKDKTHRVLNELREKLHERMYDGKVHISQRVEAGDLLGQLGGSPLYEICGQALILKEDYWVDIGEEGQTLEFEMGDLEGGDDDQTVDGKLYRVKNLPAFKMAGFLTTNAQYRCFVQSKAYEDAAWWPGEAGEWFEWQGDKQPWSLRKTDEFGYGLSPVTSTYWHAQAYALWEQAQREENPGSQRNQGPAPSRPATRWQLQLPSEAQWECAARWPHSVEVAAQRGKQSQEGGRWRFGYTAGEESKIGKAASDAETGTGFADVQPWDFNHNQILGGRTSAVGVFVASDARAASWPQEMALRDLAGNAWEWCRSALKAAGGPWKLGPQVEAEAQGRELRALRGGCFNLTAAHCRAGNRFGDAPGYSDNFDGFRLVLAVGL